MDSSSFFTAIGSEELEVGATAVGLTVVEVNGVWASKVHVTVETQAIRYTYDGSTPTAAVGHPVAAGSSFAVYGPENVARLQMIAQTGTADIYATIEAV